MPSGNPAVSPEPVPPAAVTQRSVPGGANPLSLKCRGRWLRVAQVADQIWLEGQPNPDPRPELAALRAGSPAADLFTFAQKLPQTEPRHSYHLEWDNVAVARTSDYEAWWTSLPQESRKNVRRAGRRGVVTQPGEFNDQLIRGIKEIYDETPLRQGRRFWHYQKDLATVRRENASYLDRSWWLVALHGGELIGFLKMVRVDRTARIMQILSKEAHTDKRPTNTLLAAAVETCSRNGLEHLIYGQYVYGRKTSSPVTEFKRRNGFEQVNLPRYYVPLTWRGRLALSTGLHRGWTKLLPEPVASALFRLRLRYYEQVRFRHSRPPAAAPEPPA